MRNSAMMLMLEDAIVEISIVVRFRVLKRMMMRNVAVSLSCTIGSNETSFFYEGRDLGKSLTASGCRLQP
jgi:hypothetical protein